MSDVDAMIEEAAKAMRHHHSSGCARVVSGAPCTCGIVAFAAKALESLGLPLATLAALKAGTWQAVPKEPTEDIGFAMAECDGWDREDRGHPPLTRWFDYYDAALAAAATQPEDQP